jgi:hypothetical protein
MKTRCDTPAILSADDAKQSLTDHAAGKGVEIHLKHGPIIGWSQLLHILEDPSCVRYPCQIIFDQRELLSGELAHVVPKGDRPEDGFTVYVHPKMLTQLDKAPLVVLYQLVVVNYGPFASSADAEVFGAGALGMTTDDYYRALCRLADEIGECSPA